MATKTVVLIESDLSGIELTDDTHARVQVKLPDRPGWVELDLSTEEAGKLADSTLRLVEFNILEPGKPPRTALVETKH